MEDNNMSEQITFRGDHGLKITISKEMYKKAVKVRREGKYHIVSIDTNKWDEITEEDYNKDK